jgi:hypothetical protein
MMFRALGRATNCEITKAARQNIVQRVFVNNPRFFLGRAARYLTTAQRRQHRALHPGTRAQHRAAASQGGGQYVLATASSSRLYPVTGPSEAERIEDANYERALWAAQGVQLDHQMVEQQS